MTKKILYIDMDGVLVDFRSSFSKLEDDLKFRFKDNMDDIPSIFSLMDPMVGAVDAYHELAKAYDTYILSTAPWHNHTAWSDKILWVQKHLGEVEGTPAYKRLILSHHKHLNAGDYLIDDRTANGADRFTGEHIHFGQDPCPNWEAVLKYLL